MGPGAMRMATDLAFHEAFRAYEKEARRGWRAKEELFLEVGRGGWVLGAREMRYLRHGVGRARRCWPVPPWRAPTHRDATH
jgi:hypothetical protein